MEPKWLSWAKQLQSIAQAGLAYSKDKYDIEKIKNLFCNESGYQTPKVDIRGAVFKEDKILLVKEKNNGFWSIPGGWAEFNLSIKENVIKEVKEEAGLDVVPKRLIAVLDSNKHNKPVSAYGIYKIFVLCEFKGGNFESNIETDESGYFKLSDLPPLSIDRITKEQIKLCFKAKYNDNFLAIFD
jgi:ADP-ribose pyrophosphatase YjhB (NUDIX family)